MQTCRRTSAQIFWASAQNLYFLMQNRKKQALFFNDFGTIWQNSLRFHRILWYFKPIVLGTIFSQKILPAQNFQSENSACAKELTLKGLSPGLPPGPIWIFNTILYFISIFVSICIKKYYIDAKFAFLESFKHHCSVNTVVSACLIGQGLILWEKTSDSAYFFFW